MLESEGVSVSERAAFVAGHSLGEYSALCAAGTFSLSDTAKLLDIRGHAMQAAVPVGEGAMAAVLGLDMDAVKAVAAEAAQGEVCDVANDNAPGQVVVSGSAAAVTRAIVLAKAAGAKRALPLPVSAPFHCALMAPAAEKMAEALARRDDQRACGCRLSPMSRRVRKPTPVRSATILLPMVTGMVRWTESASWLAGEGGVDTLLELGRWQGVLTGLAKRIASSASARALGTPEDIAAYLQGDG